MVRCNVVSTMTRPDVVAEIAKWFGSRVPADWFRGPPELTVDGEEILVAGELADRPGGGRRPSAARSRRVSAGGAAASGAVEEAETIKAFREATREARVRIASDAERRFGRKVSWGASCGETSILFTTVSVPVMTRLRIAERRVLDTLVETGVARSRSDALAWCVRLVGRHEADWLTDLRDALVHVQRVRSEGPTSI